MARYGRTYVKSQRVEAPLIGVSTVYIEASYSFKYNIIAMIGRGLRLLMGAGN